MLYLCYMITSYYDYHEFMEYVWDYVSMDVVTDKFWEENKDFIEEVSFSIYRYEIAKNGDIHSEESKLIIAKSAAVIIELFLDMIINCKYNSRILYVKPKDIQKYFEFIVPTFRKFQNG